MMSATPFKSGAVLGIQVTGKGKFAKIHMSIQIPSEVVDLSATAGFSKLGYKPAESVSLEFFDMEEPNKFADSIREAVGAFLRAHADRSEEVF